MQPDQPELYPAARRMRQSLPLYGHLIGNEWVDGNGSPLPVTAPATDKPLAWLARGGVAEIDAAVAAAKAALRGDWGKRSATERGRIMTAFAQKVLEHV